MELQLEQPERKQRYRGNDAVRYVTQFESIVELVAAVMHQARKDAKGGDYEARAFVQDVESAAITHLVPLRRCSRH